MPISTVSKMFYIGNFADLDTDESDWDNENPNAVLGNHDSLQLLDVTTNDQNEDGILSDNDAGNGSTDNFQYNAGSGTKVSTLDSTSVYSAEVLLGDGTISNVQIIMAQLVNGDAFIIEHPSFPLDNLKIQSIEITSAGESNYGGFSPNYSIENTEVVCFSSGTLISTPQGPIPVEHIVPGMLVCTLDHGDQPVRWCNTSTSLRAGKNAPFTLHQGCLGPNLPGRNLRLSPQHRVLLGSKIIERMFDTPQVLAHAKHLLDLPGVTQQLRFLPVTYHHFACARHEVVFAEGAAVETFYAGPQARAALSPAATQRLLQAIPKLQNPDPPPPARPFASPAKTRRIVARHLKNAQALVQSRPTAPDPMCLS